MRRKRSVRVFPLLVLIIAAFVLAVCSVAVFRHGPGEMTKGYLVGTNDNGSCTGHLATTPGGSPTVKIALRKTKSGSGCAKRAEGHRVYYDPTSLKEVPGPTNYLVGGGLLAFFALLSLAAAAWFGLPALPARRRALPDGR